MLVFFTFLNTRIWWGTCNQAVASGISRSICMSLIVMTADLMFRKIFELLWFDKIHVEMDLVWLWRRLWWFLFVGYLNKCWILLQNSNCSCVTTLSILVIVNVSVTATCAWPRKLGISLDTIVEIQATQLLTWNFARSITDLRYFLD